MTTVSIRLPEQLLKELDKVAKRLKLPRTEYIRQAIEAMNKEVVHKDRYNRLVKLSHRVRKESMAINAEFDEIENEPSS
jgi:metal-responsive CopG/Arc/MetJ family transcriptional regulator